MSFAASRLIGEQPLDSLLSESVELVSDVWDDDVPGSIVGRFTVQPDGGAIVTMQVRREGVEVLRVQGVRRSATTLRWRDRE